MSWWPWCGLKFWRFPTRTLRADWDVLLAPSAIAWVEAFATSANYKMYGVCMSDEKTPGPKRFRRLSRFLCREMLYDFATEQLDPERRRSVQEYLKTSEEQRQELQELRQAMDYCQDLAATTVSQPLLEEFKNSRSPAAEFRRKIAWKNWPEFLKWGIEAFAISAVVAMVAIVTPWEKVREWLPNSQKKYILAELEKDKPPQPPPSTATHLDSELIKSLGQSKKFIGPMLPTPTPTSNLRPSAPVAVAKPPPSEIKLVPDTALVAKRSTDVMAGEMTEKMAEKNSQPQQDQDPQAPTVTVKDSGGQQPWQGVLYRASMTNDNLDSVTPLMKAEIEKLGGEKAGRVELGWRQADNVRYFHFTLPQVKYEELLKNLRYFGPVRIYKEAHWRQMPENQIRIILTVEANKK